MLLFLLKKLDKKTRWAGVQTPTRLKAFKFKSQKKYATAHEIPYKRRARGCTAISRN